MLKGFRQIAFLTTVSRVLGMVRDIAFAHFFGAGWLMTAWAMGFKIPNLTRRLFGEGAASASLIPVYSEELEHRPQQAGQLINTVLTVLFVVLAAVVLIGEGLIWGYYALFESRTGPRIGLALCSIMLPYMIFICTVAILGGILNVHRRFATPAAAPIVLNVFIIASMLLTGSVLDIKPEQQVFFVAAAVLIAGLVQIAIQLPSLRASGVSFRPAWEIHCEAFRKIIVLMGPMIIGLTATQLNALADDIIALSFMNEQGYPLDFGSVSYLYYAQRLYQFPLGVLGISMAIAVFPVMSSEAARKDFGALAKTIAQSLRGVVFVAIPATAGIFLVAKPLVSAIFEHGAFAKPVASAVLEHGASQVSHTSIVAWTLSFYAVGLCGYFSQQIVTRAFYSMQDSGTPMRSALAAVAVNVVLNLILIWYMGTAGLALSTAICSYLQVVILMVALRKRIGRSILDGFLLTLIKTLLSTVLMCVVAAVIIHRMGKLPENRLFNILRLAAVVPSAAVVYLLAAKLLRIEMLSLITGRRQR